MFSNRHTDFSNNRGVRLSEALQDTDAPNWGQVKNYADAGDLWQLVGSVLSPKLGSYVVDAGGNKITGGVAGTAASDFVIKSQLDQPINRIVFGTGNGIGSSSDFQYNVSTNIMYLAGKASIGGLNANARLHINTEEYIQVGNNGTGVMAAFGVARRTGDGSLGNNLDYSSYMAYGAAYESATDEWVSKRPDLLGGWVLQMGHHRPFRIRRATALDGSTGVISAFADYMTVHADGSMQIPFYGTQNYTGSIGAIIGVSATGYLRRHTLTSLKSEFDVDQPNGQIVYGTGAGLSSNSSATIAGGIISSVAYSGQQGVFKRLGDNIIVQATADGNAASGWIRFKENSGANIGYIGYGSGGNSNIQVSNSIGDIDVSSAGGTVAEFLADRTVRLSAYQTNESSPVINGLPYFESGSGLLKRTSIEDLADEIESNIIFPAQLWQDGGTYAFLNKSASIGGNVIGLGLSSFLSIGGVTFERNSYVVPAGAGTTNGVYVAVARNTTGDLLYGLDVKKFYKIRVTTTGTGTNTGTYYLAWYESDSGVWMKRLVSAPSLGSNVNELVIEEDAGVWKLKVYNNHPAEYGANVTVETFHVEDDDAMPHLFGADYNFTRLGNNLDYSDGNVVFGQKLGIGRPISTYNLTVKEDISIQKVTASNGTMYLNQKLIDTGTPYGYIQVGDGTNYRTLALNPTAGNVIVGGSGASPSGKLQVNGSVGNWYVETNGAAMNFTRPSANYIRAITAGGYLIYDSKITHLFRVNDIANFQVNDNGVTIYNRLYDNNNNAGSIGQYLKATGSGINWSTIDYSEITNTPTIPSSIWQENVNGSYYVGNIALGTTPINYTRFYSFYQDSSASSRYGAFFYTSNIGSGASYGIYSRTITVGSLALSGDFRVEAQNGSTKLTALRTQLVADNGGNSSIAQNLEITTPFLNNSATIGTAYGVDISNQYAAGVTTPYGIRIKEQRNTSNGLGYNILSDGSNSKNLFAGLSSFGHVASPVAVMDIRASTTENAMVITGPDSLVQMAMTAYVTSISNANRLFDLSGFSGQFPDTTKKAAVYFGGNSLTRHMEVYFNASTIHRTGRKGRYGEMTQAETFAIPFASTFRRGSTAHKKLRFSVGSTSTTTDRILHIFGSVDGQPIDMKVLITTTSTTITYELYGGSSEYPSDISITVDNTGFYLQLERGTGENWANSMIMLSIFKGGRGSSLATFYPDITSLA